MGRILQIRVSAWTFDPAEVQRRWPSLSALAFSPVAVKIAALPPETRGVLELVDHLSDRLEIGMLPGGTAGAATRELATGIRKAAGERAKLTAELAEWNARAANTATDAIEEALDELENQAKGLGDLPGRDD